MGFRHAVQRSAIVVLASAILAVPAVASSHKTSSKTDSSGSHAVSSSGSKSSKGHVKRASRHGRGRYRGQQAIDSGRVRQIQAALVREHYLAGQPTGAWDTRSKEAMLRYQSDNGWQTKKVPDSRAIIKLGLGPDHTDLLNPDTAFISQPQPGKGGAAVPER